MAECSEGMPSGAPGVELGKPLHNVECRRGNGGLVATWADWVAEHGLKPHCSWVKSERQMGKGGDSSSKRVGGRGRKEVGALEG